MSWNPEKVIENWNIKFQYWKSYGKMLFSQMSWKCPGIYFGRNKKIQGGQNVLPELSYWGGRTGIIQKCGPKIQISSKMLKHSLLENLESCPGNVMEF